MPDVTYTDHTGASTTISGAVGECGGVLSCATCHVFINPDDLDRLPAMSDLEDEMLDGAAEDRRDTSRLSCQIELTDELSGLRVTTPEHQQ